jgi:ATP-dependent Clp protease adaptor protein ClpS
MATKKRNSDGGLDLIDKEKEKQELEPPSKYNVVFYNDDYTPMDFVVFALTDIFNHQTSAAMKIMMDVHEKGKAIAGGPYTKEIAEMKITKVMDFATSCGHPLMAVAKKE